MIPGPAVSASGTLAGMQILGLCSDPELDSGAEAQRSVSSGPPGDSEAH